MWNHSGVLLLDTLTGTLQAGFTVINPGASVGNLDERIKFDVRASQNVGNVLVGPLPPAAWAGLGSLACVAGFGVIRRRRMAAN